MGQLHTSGIGFDDDAQILSIKKITEEDFSITPGGIIEPSGIINGTEIVNSIDLSDEIDIWAPVIKTGFLYLEDQEFYLYSNKVTEVYPASQIPFLTDALITSHQTDDDNIFDPSLLATRETPSDSGYFEFKLSGIPRKGAPIVVKILSDTIANADVSVSWEASDSFAMNYVPFIDVDPEDPIIDLDSLPSITDDSYTNFMTLFYEFNTSADKPKNIFGTVRSADDHFKPIVFSRSPLSITGFNESLVFENQHIYKILPVICVDSSFEYDNTDGLLKAYFYPETNIIRIPGEISNVSIEYEGSNNNTLILRTMDINPLENFNFSNIIRLSSSSDDSINNITITPGQNIQKTFTGTTNRIQINTFDTKQQLVENTPISIIMDQERLLYNSDTKEFIDIPDDLITVVPSLLDGCLVDIMTINWMLLDNDNYIITDKEYHVITIIERDHSEYITESFGAFILQANPEEDISIDFNDIIIEEKSITLPTDENGDAILTKNITTTTDTDGGKNIIFIGPDLKRDFINYNISVIYDDDISASVDLKWINDDDNSLIYGICKDNGLPHIATNIEFWDVVGGDKQNKILAYQPIQLLDSVICITLAQWLISMNNKEIPFNNSNQNTIGQYTYNISSNSIKSDNDITETMVIIYKCIKKESYLMDKHFDIYNKG